MISLIGQSRRSPPRMKRKAPPRNTPPKRSVAGFIELLGADRLHVLVIGVFIRAGVTQDRSANGLDKRAQTIADEINEARKTARGSARAISRTYQRRQREAEERSGGSIIEASEERRKTPHRRSAREDQRTNRNAAPKPPEEKIARAEAQAAFGSAQPKRRTLQSSTPRARSSVSVWTPAPRPPSVDKAIAEPPRQAELAGPCAFHRAPHRRRGGSNSFISGSKRRSPISGFVGIDAVRRGNSHKATFRRAAQGRLRPASLDVWRVHPRSFVSR